jgi:hypothetical protein
MILGLILSNFWSHRCLIFIIAMLVNGFISSNDIDTHIVRNFGVADFYFLDSNVIGTLSFIILDATSSFLLSVQMIPVLKLLTFFGTADA